MFPPKINFGLCPQCRGSGYKKDSDFTRLDCICEETGNKYFEVNHPYFCTGVNDLDLLSYEDKSIYDKLIEMDYFRLWDCIQYNEDGLDHIIYINATNRLEPFYSLKDWNLNNYNLKPVENPLFPFIGK